MKMTMPASGDLRVKADQLLADWANLPIAQTHFIDHINMHSNGTIQLTIKPNPGNGGN